MKKTKKSHHEIIRIEIKNIVGFNEPVLLDVSKLDGSIKSFMASSNLSVEQQPVDWIYCMIDALRE